MVAASTFSRGHSMQTGQMQSRSGARVAALASPPSSKPAVRRCRAARHHVAGRGAHLPPGVLTTRVLFERVL